MAGKSIYYPPLNNTVIVKVLGITDRGLLKFRTVGGLPYGKSGKRIFYKAEDLYDWLTRTQRVEYAVKLHGYLKNKYPGRMFRSVTKTHPESDAVKKPGRKKKTVETKTDIVDGEVLFISEGSEKDEIGLFEAHGIIGELLQKAVIRTNDAGDNTAAITSETNNIKNLSAELRQLELAKIEVDEKLKQVIPLAEAKRFIASIAINLKTDLQALPFALADTLSAKLGTKNNSEVLDILKKSIDDALRHLSKEFEIK